MVSGEEFFLPSIQYEMQGNTLVPRSVEPSLRSLWALPLVSFGSAVTAADHHNARSVAPPEVVAVWQKGTWSNFGTGFPLTGFEDEDHYDDPTQEPPHPLPFKPPYDAKWKWIREQSFAGHNVLDTGAACIPLGVPFQDSFGIIQFLFAPDRVVTTGLFDNGVRNIYTDGRPHLAAADPSFNGDSIGHWEGTTLVVDVTNIALNAYLEEGLLHSDRLHVVERWNFVDSASIRVDVTIFDDGAFSRPLHEVLTWHHDPNGRLPEDLCENNRDPNVNGATTMIDADGTPLLGSPDGHKATYKVVK
jgi:hypothetical protein